VIVPVVGGKNGKGRYAGGEGEGVALLGKMKWPGKIGGESFPSYWRRIDDASQKKMLDKNLPTWGNCMKKKGTVLLLK